MHWKSTLALLVAAGQAILSPLRHLALPFWGKIAQVAVPVIALVLCYILCGQTHTEVAVPAAIVEMNTKSPFPPLLAPLLPVATADFRSW